MSPRSVKEWEAYAARRLAETLAGMDQEAILAALCTDDPNFALVDSSRFALEYLAARLALACRAWESGCLENNLKEDSVTKALLRAVMKSFKSEDQVPVAAAFSEYLHAGEESQGASVAVAERFFQRVEVDAIVSTAEGSQRAASAAFERLVLLSESFRTELENEIFEFIHNKA